jgi:hypothetical protein
MLSKVAIVAAGFASVDGHISLRGAPATGMNKTLPKEGLYVSGYNEYEKKVIHKNVHTHTDDWLDEPYQGAHPANGHEDMDEYTARICGKDTQGDHTYAAKNQETEFCKLFLAGQKGLFLAQMVKDPRWDETKIQDAGAYQDDFVKDDRPNVTGEKPNVPFTYAEKTEPKSVVSTEAAVVPPKKEPEPDFHGVVTSPAVTAKEGTPAFYEQKCDKLNAQCKMLKDHRLRIAKLDIQHFENDYIRQKRILDARNQHHMDQKADVAAQKKEVAQVRRLVKAAQVTVNSKKHCPPELEAAQADLASLEAKPNHVPEDIELECSAQQRVLVAQKCVEELREAEAVLAEHQDDHNAEKNELHEERKHVSPAAKKLPPQEQRVQDALEAWNRAKAKPLSGSIAGIESTCQAERDDLISSVGVDLDALRRALARQKALLGDKEQHHAQQKEHVVAQKVDVATTQAQVEKAKTDVEDKAHCPPELEAAQDALAKLRAIPNKTPSDIDAECKAEQRVLDAQKCVDELRTAEAILENHRDNHSAEKSQLADEHADVHQAKAALPPQEQKVADAQAALDAAMALMRALRRCQA